MTKYTVFFRIYDKGLKVTTEAKSEAEAKQKVKDAIKFDKIEGPKNDNHFDFLKDIFGMN